MHIFSSLRSLFTNRRIKLIRFDKITYRDSWVYSPVQQKARAFSLTLSTPSRHVSKQKLYRLSTPGICPRKLLDLGFAAAKGNHLKGSRQIFGHTSGFRPNNIKLHTWKSHNHQEGTLANYLLQNGGSNIYAQFGAFIVGFSLFSYGTLRFCDSDYKLSSTFMQPVHASADFERNNFIADVVEKAGPAVVFLEIKGRHPLTGRPVTLSNGSGFIVRSNGIILTNAHVVANKSSVSVKLQDGRVFEGQVTAVDPISDLAAVKIPTSSLPTIPLGNSTDIRPGEWVIAMGSPLSLSNTVTCGIVSSVQRASKELGLRNKNMDYIQTDAVINFGNSGGPLVNLDGRAIGINTMKVTTGISFAIPSDYAIKFLTKAEALMKNGKTENGFLKRRYMGITMLTLTEGVMRDLRNNIKMPNFADVKGGVFVYKVIPGSPAHLGGIFAGDIIIEISGVAIRSAADVYDAVEKGDHLKVTVIRGSDKKTISINTQETI